MTYRRSILRALYLAAAVLEHLPDRTLGNSATMPPYIPSGSYTIPPGIVTGGVSLAELISNCKARRPTKK